MNGSEPGQLARRPETSASALPDDAQIVAGLRAGDEELFAHVIEVWAPTMLRLARSYVHTRESAADIVQETWLAVLRGIDRFEGRSALRTWVFRILSNIDPKEVMDKEAPAACKLETYEATPSYEV